MVTADIHRVFRMAESLNNKTGLVKRRSLILASFDPFSEAVALPEEDELVSIIVDMCPRVILWGRHWTYPEENYRKGTFVLAVYLISRGAAKIDVKKSETVGDTAQASKSDVVNVT